MCVCVHNFASILDTKYFHVSPPKGVTIAISEWKMLFHEICRKRILLETAALIELHPDFRIAAMTPLYMSIYKTILRKVPLPCFPHFQEIIERDLMNSLLHNILAQIHKKQIGWFIGARSPVLDLSVCSGANTFLTYV